MSYPAMHYQEYPSGFNTFYNRGYSDIWSGAGKEINIDTYGRTWKTYMPVMKNNFVDGDFVNEEPKIVKRTINKGGKKKMKEVEEVKEVESQSDNEDMAGGYGVANSKPMKGEDGKEFTKKDVMAYRKNNKVSLKEAWAHFKRVGEKPMTEAKKKAIDRRAEMSMQSLRNLKKRTDSKVKSVKSKAESAPSIQKKRKYNMKEIMNYKINEGVSLKDAWAHFKKSG